MKINKNQPRDLKKEIRQETHLTRPARLEGVVKEAQMQPVKKEKKEHLPL